ncbi:Septation initiation network scaffold protein cdc11 [Neolecta irregularis DAH-3]|uniref:Septation initiation network scaffold protein cdc11 n=1 Tax=Neolecta irregularis (strain DAH-3) TaxID=1198029 RepID=A0A1U7LX22_NEOID|nr:Septation initiation network scaffold protein cdc11 [Neolecta irregularis DAH-3]|eukprot:OLL27071.1 Septation initiation network scaffold protein cdc11 [Neolecta irregularis DAH-3]
MEIHGDRTDIASVIGSGDGNNSGLNWLCTELSEEWISQDLQFHSPIPNPLLRPETTEKTTEEVHTVKILQERITTTLQDKLDWKTKPIKTVFSPLPLEQMFRQPPKRKLLSESPKAFPATSTLRGLPRGLENIGVGISPIGQIQSTAKAIVSSDTTTDLQQGVVITRCRKSLDNGDSDKKRTVAFYEEYHPFTFNAPDRPITPPQKSISVPAKSPLKLFQKSYDTFTNSRLTELVSQMNIENDHSGVDPTYLQRTPKRPKNRADRRTGSVTTEDFLMQAEEVMGMIRGQNRLNILEEEDELEFKRLEPHSLRFNQRLISGQSAFSDCSNVSNVSDYRNAQRNDSLEVRPSSDQPQLLRPTDLPLEETVNGMTFDRRKMRWVSNVIEDEEDVFKDIEDLVVSDDGDEIQTLQHSPADVFSASDKKIDRAHELSFIALPVSSRPTTGSTATTEKASRFIKFDQSKSTGSVYSQETRDDRVKALNLPLPSASMMSRPPTAVTITDVPEGIASPIIVRPSFSRSISSPIGSSLFETRPLLTRANSNQISLGAPMERIGSQRSFDDGLNRQEIRSRRASQTLADVDRIRPTFGSLTSFREEEIAKAAGSTHSTSSGHLTNLSPKQRGSAALHPLITPAKSVTFEVNLPPDHPTPFNYSNHDISTMSMDCSFSIAVGAMVRHLTDVEPYEPHWERMTELNLSARRLDSLVRLSDFCPKLESLDASDNAVGFLTGVPTTLRILKVQNNRLSDLTGFSHLGNIQYLNLTGNDLENVNALSTLVHLRELIINDNKLADLEGIMQIDGLLKLKARNNKLRSLDFSHSKLPRLEELDLSVNALETITGVEGLRSLMSFHLDDNRLVQFCVPEKMDRLRTLRLCRNKLSKFDASWFLNLRTLYLDDNSLNHVTGLKLLRQLENFSIRDQTGSTDIVVQSRHVADAKRLFLSGNTIPGFSFSQQLYNLQYLELAAVKLTSLPLELTQTLINCRILNLSYNSIKDISSLQNLPKLKRLFLVGNRLKSMREVAETLVTLPSLSVVDLRMNPITLSFYPPVNNITDHPSHRDAYNLATNKDQQDDWTRRDAAFCAKLTRHWQFQKKAYKALLVSACPLIKWVDGNEVDVNETGIFEQFK